MQYISPEVNVDPPKPKRGRPKLKEQNTEPKIKAKRGRKPLVKTLDEEVKIPKKRGRKPKERFYAVSKEPILFNIENISDNLLHLEKINKDDFKIESNNSSPVNYFQPYEPYENTFHTLYEIPKKEQISVDFESSDLKLLPDLYSSHSWPMKTKIHCWWCCYDFDTVPIPLPKKINNIKSLNPKDNDIENFEVKGCFCSFNCALAYSNTYDFRNIQYLILFFFKRIYKLNNPSTSNEFFKNFSIKPAPPKEVLEIFGGPISISEYRKSFENSTNYRIIDLPSMSSKQYLDIIEDKQYKKKNNETIIKTPCLSSSLKKQTPKVYSKNTLEHLMSMQIIH
jgi:hypothetical protein